MLWVDLLDTDAVNPYGAIDKNIMYQVSKIFSSKLAKASFLDIA